MPLAVVTFRWAPMVDNTPYLEYGLYARKRDAVKAARSIAEIRGATHADACKVYYRIER
jgi:hypothetical protein